MKANIKAKLKEILKFVYFFAFKFFKIIDFIFLNFFETKKKIFKMKISMQVCTTDIKIINPNIIKKNIELNKIVCNYY